jgi:hypothetical protein
MIIEYCKRNLNEIKDFVKVIDEDTFNFPSLYLNRSTIGQHVRHILEFYICLVNSKKPGIINYDLRKRDKRLERSLPHALEGILKIISGIDGLDAPGMILMQSNFGLGTDSNFSFPSSMARELAYCLEHSIHHQALIKVALIEMKLGHLVTPTFGVAPSTLRQEIHTNGVS